MYNGNTIMDIAAFDFVVLPLSFQRPWLEAQPSSLASPNRFFSKEELLGFAFFRYEEAATFHLYEHFRLSLTEARNRLKQLYFLPEAPTGDPRVDRLVAMRSSLRQAGLVIETDFSGVFVGKKCLIVGYSPDDPELNAALTKLKLKAEYFREESHEQPRVASFGTIKEEVSSVFENIASLLDAGVPLMDIRIHVPADEYRFDLELHARYFGIPVNIPETDAWGATPVGIYVKQRILDGASGDEIIAQAPVEFGLDATHPIFHKLASLSSLPMEPGRKRELLIETIDDMSLERPTITPELRMMTAPIADARLHVFVLGANDGQLPYLWSDDDYLSDRQKRALGQLTSTVKNDHERTTWFRYFKSQPNLYVSWLRQSKGDEGYPSPLLKEVDVVPWPSSLGVSYASRLGVFAYAAMLDQRRVYHTTSPYLEAYGRALPIAYRTFDYAYKPFDVGQGETKLQFAYSGIKTYYQCPFRYYLEAIVKLDDDEEDNFFIKFGNLAHEILSRKYEEGFDFETVYQELTTATAFDPKEKVLLLRLKQDLAAVIAYNAEHEAAMERPRVACEVETKFALDAKTYLKGKIDKVVITGADDGAYASLIDYKTGSESFEPREIPFGFSLQLPIYALLIERDERFCDVEIIGYYIQNIIAAKLVRPVSKDAREFYREQLRLRGMALADIRKLATFDGTLAESNYIQSLRLTKKGAFDKRSKVATASAMKAHRDQALQKVLEACAAIRASAFHIIPKKIDGDDMSCKYCHFRDICFRPELAYQNLSTKHKETDDGPLME